MNDLYEQLQDAEDQYAEMEAQFGSECALYGDAWPGSQDQLTRLLDWINATRKELGMEPKPSRMQQYLCAAADRFGPSC